MRAAARCKEGRTLLQTTFQPAVDSLLAERLVSSALAGPSTASSLVQLASRTVSTQPGSSVGGLSRLYFTVARRNASLWNSAGVGPSQQVCHRSLLARAGAAGLYGHLFHIFRRWSRMLHSHVLQLVCLASRQMQLSRGQYDDTSAANLHAKVFAKHRPPDMCSHGALLLSSDWTVVSDWHFYFWHCV